MGHPLRTKLTTEVVNTNKKKFKNPSEDRTQMVKLRNGHAEVHLWGRTKKKKAF